MKRIALLAMMLIPLAVHAADEITANVVLKVTDGNLDYQRAVNVQFDITNATPNSAAGTQTITTNAPVAITVGSVATPGWTYWRNLTTNTTRYVELGTGTGIAFRAFGKLRAGEYGLLRLGTTAPYAKSYGGTVRLETAIIDD